MTTKNSRPFASTARQAKPRHFSRGSIAVWALIAACCLASSRQATAAPQILHGHVPAATKRLSSIGRLDAGAAMDVTIGLPLRNREALTNLLQEIYQPGHPNFRHYLTPDQFAANFAPSQEDYQAVIDFAKSHGLTVQSTHPNRTLLHLRGSVADIEKTFHVKMRVFQHPAEARTFFAPDTEPSLDLATPVLAVSGLNNYTKPRPRIRRLSARPQAGPGPGGGPGGGGSGGGGSYLGYDFRNAYAPGVVLDGTGQYVGLFELTGYSEQDIRDYESEADLPSVPLQNILIDGFNGDDSNMDYAVEATADIEMAISMAPGLSGVLVYEGPTPLYEPPIETNYIQYAGTTVQINDVFNRMATDNLAKQLSCSYQMDINLSTVQIFQQFAAQGQSFFQASGDSGAFPGTIDSPADDPYITVVGGTTLTTSSADGSWQSETVWLTPAASDPLFGDTPEESTGGGVSLAYAIPVWQQGISMTANQGSTTMRNLPDVAMVADNVDLVWGNDGIGESFDFTEGGTSLAAPLWAGFMALANQQAVASGLPSVGFANPALYAIAKSTNYQACFHDITTGNNFTTNSPTKYAATVGYDLCTGWGTPSGSNLINALLAPPSETLVIHPPLGFTSFGPGRGPFSVASQTFTLTNIGTSSLNWGIVNTSRWLHVSATNGTLNPRAPAGSVTVSINASVTNFLIGTYSDSISFVNLADGSVQSRQFDLSVGNGGFETGDLTGWTMVGATNLVFALAADDLDVAGEPALPGASDGQFVHSGLYGAFLGQFPTNGSLAQTLATTPGQRYSVSFWLTDVVVGGSSTPNNFVASWNGSALYARTNLDAFGWTQQQFLVSATTSSTVLEFSFDNDPGSFGLDDIRVETVPAPVLRPGAIEGGSITLTWSGLATLKYQIQSAADLTKPQWANVLGPITATGNIVTASVPINVSSPQFYRVVLLPPP